MHFRPALFLPPDCSAWPPEVLQMIIDINEHWTNRVVYKGQMTCTEMKPTTLGHWGGWLRVLLEIQKNLFDVKGSESVSSDLRRTTAPSAVSLFTAGWEYAGLQKWTSWNLGSSRVGMVMTLLVSRTNVCPASSLITALAWRPACLLDKFSHFGDKLMPQHFK